MSAATEGYQYDLDQCDVLPNRESLRTFRLKRQAWLAWLETDEHHAIVRAIQEMAWNDVVFRTFQKIAGLDPACCLHNMLVSESLIRGHFSAQILIIRRLMDKRDDVVSLRMLLEDIKANIAFFSREHFVCYDGLPYNYEAAELRAQAGSAKNGAVWQAKTGPDAWVMSKLAHEQFDRLTQISPANRKRGDCVPVAVPETLLGWINTSGAKDLVTWSHKYLAHAADENSRQKVDFASVEANQITQILRCLVHTTEIVCCLLQRGGPGMCGMGEVVPRPGNIDHTENGLPLINSRDQFAFLLTPLLETHRKEIVTHWNALTKDRNNFLEGTWDALASALTLTAVQSR
jgi:hypothetical protein